MKTFMKYLFYFFMVCAVGMMAQAADKSVNRKMGYFDNTRTVLLFLPQSNDRGSYAASYIAKEMDAVFRYPYYRKLDTVDYAYKNISLRSFLPLLRKRERILSYFLLLQGGYRGALIRFPFSLT